MKSEVLQKRGGKGSCALLLEYGENQEDSETLQGTCGEVLNREKNENIYRGGLVKVRKMKKKKRGCGIVRRKEKGRESQRPERTGRKRTT